LPESHKTTSLAAKFYSPTAIEQASSTRYASTFFSNNDNIFPMSNHRFFSSDSFWNQPIAESTPTDPRSALWISMLECDKPHGLYINLREWTIPVYEVNDHTPLVQIHRTFERQPATKYEYKHMRHFLERSRHRLSPEHPYGHGPGFGPLIPLPAHARPDGQGDAHLALVDRERGVAWDMWALSRRPDGGWESCTGMTYALDGSGVFAKLDPGPEDGESVHLYGPSRAPGVPAIAGLIMRDEIRSGRIEHKLACATNLSAYKEFCAPAIWGDGCTPGGIPQGAVLQLDPCLDLDALPLGRGGKIVARALQEYGMVNVDHSAGLALYGEGLWPHDDPDWSPWLIETALAQIPRGAFRVLEIPLSTRMGYDASHRQADFVHNNPKLMSLCEFSDSPCAKGQSVLPQQ
jgi:hypothetical protein